VCEVGNWFIGLTIVSIGERFEHFNELSVYIKAGNFLISLGNCCV